MVLMAGMTSREESHRPTSGPKMPFAATLSKGILARFGLAGLSCVTLAVPGDSAW